MCVIPISKGYERSCAESEAENLSETMCFFVSGFVAGDNFRRSGEFVSE